MTDRNIVELLYIDNHNLLRVDKVKDKRSGGGFLNSATVTATLYESDGSTEVTGQTWPVTLGYVAASDGRYEGLIDDVVVIVDGTRYLADIRIVDSGTGLKAKILYKVTARPRTA